MRDGTFIFTGKWAKTVRELGETGMGYTVVSITLVDGQVFSQVIIDTGHLTRVRGLTHIPFAENDIAAIKRTDAKWDWNESP